MLPLGLFAQEADTTRVRFSLDFALDYGKVLTLPSSFETKIEVATGFTLSEKMEFILELGYGNLTPQDVIKNGSYHSEGIYYRAGLAYGGQVVPKNFIRIGAMYGISNFDDGGVIMIQSEVWDDLAEEFQRTNLSAQWFEILIVTEQKINKHIFLGSKFRLRKLIKFENDYIPEVFTIPGYGRTFDTTVPVFNLFVKYKFIF